MQHFNNLTIILIDPKSKDNEIKSTYQAKYKDGWVKISGDYLIVNTIIEKFDNGVGSVTESTPIHLNKVKGYQIYK